MNTSYKIITMGICGLVLSSCVMNEEYRNLPESRYTYDPSQVYYQGDYRMSQYPYENTRFTQYRENQKTVVVPDSYHVGQTHSPISSKEVDKTWVNNQNPQGYTIEIADGDNASQVAQSLYKAPKNERMGQVKYQREGKTYYKGLYGSYDSPEAANKALDALPADIKQNAGVKNWGVVKGVVGQE